MTRARAELTLVYAARRHLYGMSQFNFPSRFLDELPPDRVVREYAEGVQPLGSADTVSPSTPDSAPAVATTGMAKYRVGMTVVHPLFGAGTVRRCATSGGEEKLIVEFQRGGMKKLVARYARLEIVTSGGQAPDS